MMKVARKPVGTRYVIHDARHLETGLVAACSRSTDPTVFHVLPSNFLTNCARCLTLRNKGTRLVICPLCGRRKRTRQAREWCRRYHQNALMRNAAVGQVVNSVIRGRKS